MNHPPYALPAEGDHDVLHAPSTKMKTQPRVWEYGTKPEVAEALASTKQIFADQTSEQAQRMRAEIERVARRPYNILITGETGTGKTHAAREIHRRQPRLIGRR